MRSPQTFIYIVSLGLTALTGACSTEQPIRTTLGATQNSTMTDSPEHPRNAESKPSIQETIPDDLDSQFPSVDEISTQWEQLSAHLLGPTQELFLATRDAVIRNPAELTSAAFKVSGVRVSLLNKILESTPVVSFFPNEAIDTYEIARCPANLIIKGVFQSLDETERFSVQIEDEIRAQVENQYWPTIESAPECSILNRSLTQPMFTDLTLQESNARYYIRGCQHTAAGRSCSPIVSASPKLTGFQPPEDFWTETLLAEVHAEESRIASLALELAMLAQNYAVAVFECEAAQHEILIEKENREALSFLLAAGGRITLDLIRNEFSSPLEWSAQDLKLDPEWQSATSRVASALELILEPTPVPAGLCGGIALTQEKIRLAQNEIATARSRLTQLSELTDHHPAEALP